MPISPAHAPFVSTALNPPRLESSKAAKTCGLNNSGRRQSWASVTKAFKVLKLPWFAPKSVSKAQNAKRTPAGIPYASSIS